MTKIDPTPPWDEYEFSPQTNITAYELAMILKDLRLPNSATAMIAGAKVPPGKPVSPVYGRHFTKKVTPAR